MIVALAGILAAVGFFLLVRLLWLKAQPKGHAALLTAATIALVVGLLLLAATGRLHWLVALGAAIFPFLRRLLAFMPIWQILRRFAPMAGQAFSHSPGAAPGAAPGGAPEHSEVQTGDLKMTLHHASGEMDGDVLAGQFQGRRLSGMGLDELRTLRATLTDSQSAPLLDTYMERRFGSAQGGAGQEQDRGTGATSDAGMTESRALEILGLEPGASEQEIVEAHRRLMQRLHPDRGGSTFLAATLNEAKRVLLKR
ncbi:MAG: molecular chaperone DnaJ [Gammaproteobacteria bacterium]|nr:molecular chaperone DnaJ [Gammaproteobacteria bacterium]